MTRTKAQRIPTIASSLTTPEFASSSETAIIADDTSNRLLALPAEIRIAIHELVIQDVPLQHHRSTYVGLIYTCKQTRAEAEPMIIQKINKISTRITKSNLVCWGDTLTFSPVQSLYDLEHLTLRFQTSFNRESYPRWTPKLHCHFSKLFDLRFHTLTIDFECNDKRIENRLASWTLSFGHAHAHTHARKRLLPVYAL